jgi:hypothetical protein
MKSILTILLFMAFGKLFAQGLFPESENIRYRLILKQIMTFV